MSHLRKVLGLVSQTLTRLFVGLAIFVLCIAANGDDLGGAYRSSNPGGVQARAMASMQAITPEHQAQISAAYGRLPLSFERNQGQTDTEVKFLSRGKGYTLFLTPTEAVLSMAAGP